jgi:hypothetical protein
MAQQLARHGSEAGYRAEIQTGDACDRCRNGHRVFDRQYSKTGKAKGIKYGRFDVLDNLYSPGRGQGKSGSVQTRTEPSGQDRARSGPEPHTTPTVSSAQISDDQGADAAESSSGPSIGERLAAGLTRLVIPDGEQYVPDGEFPEYLHEVNPDPDPPSEDGWAEVTNEEFVINAAGMRKIEDSLGTYLSVVGMTVEMIDPICGPVIAMNMQNVVVRWSKVIAHYPKAAHLFLDQKGGTLMTWMGALQATWPILYVVYEHHLAKTIKMDEQGRTMRFVSPEQAAQNGHSEYDGMTPPIHDSFRYTAE